MDTGYTYVLKSPSAGIVTGSAITLLQIKASASAPLELLRASVSQNGTTSLNASIAIVRKDAGAGTVTAGILATTVNQYNLQDPASTVQLGTTATGHTATAEGTNGAILVEESFNVLNGWNWIALPEERIWVKAAGIIGLTFTVAPTSATWRAELVFREYQ